MPAQFDLSKLSVRQFAERFRSEMIPLSNTFSYFCASVPMSDEDLKEYLQEPVAAPRLYSSSAAQSRCCPYPVRCHLSSAAAEQASAVVVSQVAAAAPAHSAPASAPRLPPPDSPPDRPHQPKHASCLLLQSPSGTKDLLLQFYAIPAL